MTLLQEIEQKNIDANMEMAMETTPESFGSVIMLYINCKYDSVLIAVDLLFTR
jgi:DNA damage-inducible protein 1